MRPAGPPLVSCVVPTFNSARFLPEALASIFDQTYRPLQVIVADDGSSDDTVTRARTHPQVVDVVRQSTAGPAATRNLGLRAARGRFVAFLDADDLWHPDKLERQMARFAARPELGVSLTHVELAWSQVLSSTAVRYRNHRRGTVVPGYATTTMLARLELFDVVGGFSDDLWFADATDWFLRAGERGAVIEMLPDVLTVHRMHEGNLTRRRADDSRGEFLDVIKASLDRRRSGAPIAGTKPRIGRAGDPS